MRISDWSSDVCSSDLEGAVGHAADEEHAAHVEVDLLEHLLAVGLAVGQGAAVAHLVAADDDDARLGAALQDDLGGAHELREAAVGLQDRKSTRLNSSH